MAEKSFIIVQHTTKPIKVMKWKVNVGTTVSIGRVVMLYRLDVNTTNEQLKLKSTKAGTIRKLFCNEGDVVMPGLPLIEVEPCNHPTVMKDMCAECGADLRKDDSITAASVPMVHSVPELKVSEEVAQRIGRADGERLLRDRKLVLLVDLDQTLIHTTNDNIPANLKDVYHFQLYGRNSPWYHTRLRPGTHHFLSNIAPFFELHICTFGARNYAHMIAMFLDHDGHYFSHRILSRDECFNPTSKTANLKALFPCGDNMVCIIDDREDVWSHATNLIHVKPYHFFQHTGDINAPPGLEKQENDKRGVDLNSVAKKDAVANERDDFNAKSPITNGNGEKTNETITENAAESSKEENTEDILKAENAEDVTKQEKCVDVSKAENNDDIVKEENAADVVSKIGNTEDVTEADNTENVSKEMIVEDFSEQANTEVVSKPTIITCNDKESNNIADNMELLMEVDEKIVKTDNVMDKNNGINSVVKENVLAEQELSESKEVTVPNAADDDVQVNNKEMNEKLIEEKSEILEEEKNSSNPSTKEGNVAKPNLNENSYNPNVTKEKSSQDLIEIEDPDDYLLYLEDILKSIHKSFYECYDKMESGEVPDLKEVIPSVRNKVLLGTKLVFSGLVPTHIKLEQSKAYQVARSLGAEVTQDLELDTTHLVAVRPGTAKVNAGKRRKQLKIVTPDWLWACAECWLKIEENLYPLNNKGSKNRHPPPHCSSPELIGNAATNATDSPSRKRTASGRFMDTINPLMSFSSADIEDMDREVEDIFNESESDTETNTTCGDTSSQIILSQLSKMSEDSEEGSSSSVESLTAELPRGFKRSRNKSITKEDDVTENNSLDEFPSTKFRRGECLESDLDIGQNSNSDGSVEPEDEIDDGDWNMMGAALEREFLANN